MAKKVFISFEEAVAEFGIEPSQLQSWMRDGQLRAFRFHETMSFKRPDVAALCEGSDARDDLEAFFPKTGVAAPAEQDGQQSESPNPTSTSIEEIFGKSSEPRGLLVPRPMDPEEDELTIPLDLLSKPQSEEDDEETFLEPLDGKKLTEKENLGATTTENKEPANASDEDRLIRFHCECGKRLKSDKNFIGLKVVCPKCGDKLKVPPKSEPRKPKEVKAPPVLAKVISKFEKVKGQVMELSARVEEQYNEGMAESGLSKRMEDLETQVRTMTEDLVAIKKENEQTRFDIARLKDLIARVDTSERDPSEEETWDDE